jgi:hypothetical protein
LIFRAAERFGQPPEWFDAQPRERQEELLFYERMREQEVAGCPLKT